jgi:hypothetical protein
MVTFSQSAAGPAGHRPQAAPALHQAPASGAHLNGLQLQPGRGAHRR